MYLTCWNHACTCKIHVRARYMYMYMHACTSDKHAYTVGPGLCVISLFWKMAGKKFWLFSLSDTSKSSENIWTLKIFRSLHWGTVNWKMPLYVHVYVILLCPYICYACMPLCYMYVMLPGSPAMFPCLVLLCLIVKATVSRSRTNLENQANRV